MQPEQRPEDVCLPFKTGILRPWTLQDAPNVAKHANNRNVWINCSDRFASPYTEEDAVNWITFCRNSSQPGHPPVQLAIQHESAGVIGGIGVFSRDGVQRHTKELGFWLGEDYWGQGIGSSVVAAFIPYIWSAFPETARLEAIVYDYNARSRKLLERHGFVLEGHLRRAAYKDGKFCDSIVFGLLNPSHGHQQK